MEESTESIAEEIKKDADKNAGENQKEDTETIPGVRGPQVGNIDKESDGATSPSNWNRFAQSETKPQK